MKNNSTLKELFPFFLIAVTVVSLSGFVSEMNEHLRYGGVAAQERFISFQSGLLVKAPVAEGEVPFKKIDNLSIYDVNNDGNIVLYYPAPDYSYADYAIVLSCWGQYVSQQQLCERGDFNADGIVDVNDANMMQELVRYDKNNNQVVELR